MNEKQYKNVEIQIKGVDKESSILDAVFSTNNEDRHGDIVEQNFDLKNFKKNPVLLNSHNYSDVNEVIGRVENLTTKSGKLEGKVRFAVAENPKSKVAYDLYSSGFLNAFSIGFIPKEFDDKGRIIKSELLEISAVSVPANAYALAKAKGIDVDLLTDHKDLGETEEETDEEIEEEVENEEIETEAQNDDISEEDDEVVEDTEEEDNEPTEAELDEIEGSQEETEEENEEIEEKQVKKVKKLSKKQIALKTLIAMEEKREKKLKEAISIINKIGEVDQNNSSGNYNSVKKTDRAIKRQMINKAIRKLLQAK